MWPSGAGSSAFGGALPCDRGAGSGCHLDPADLRPECSHGVPERAVYSTDPRPTSIEIPIPIKPAGAVGIAALLSAPHGLYGERTGTILCRGNVTVEQMTSWGCCSQQSGELRAPGDREHASVRRQSWGAREGR